MTIYGGEPVKMQADRLKSDCPHAVVGTPGRIKDLIKREMLDLSKVKHFVLDECDQMLEQLDMRKDVQEIFKATPRDKQVMFFSATLSQEIRLVCKKFMQDPMEIYVDNESKLTLHGLQQFYIKLDEKEKNRKYMGPRPLHRGGNQGDRPEETGQAGQRKRHGDHRPQSTA